MRYITQIVLTLLFSTIAWAKPTVQIYHSEATSYLHFLAAGFGEPFTSKSVKELIDKNKIRAFKKTRYKKLFDEFNSHLLNGYNFDSPETRPAGFYGQDALVSLSVTNPSLDELEKSLSLFVPYSGVSAYFSLKNKFYGPFKKHLWNPTLSEQPKEIKKAKQILKEVEFEKLLTQAKAFYKSDYPINVPFKVALVPIDDRGLKSGHTSALNLRDVQVVPYFISKGVRDNMDVIFHEFCHALYEGQTNKVKKKIEDFYLTSENPYALFVYRYLNEILATTLGNGWFKEKLDNKYPDRSWYTVTYIDKMAKALLPTVKDYINRKKPIDTRFFKKTLELAKETFPDAPYLIDTNMISLRILSSHPNISAGQVSRKLRDSFRVQSVKKSSPMRNSDWDKVTGKDVANIFLISSDANEPIAKMKLYLSKENITSINGTKNFLAIFPVKGKYVFWTNVSKLNRIGKALESIKAKKKLNKNFDLISL